MQLRAGLTVVLVLVAGAFAAAIAVLPQTARAATLYVGGPGPGNYTTIGAAVTAANPGDTVFVFAGTYPETVSIGKTISLVGENRDTTIIDGGEVYVGGASWANVTGFHLRGRGGPAGVYVWLGRNCRFEGNRISNYSVGILLNSSSSITLENNVMTGNGIFIQGEGGGGNAPEHWASHTIGVSNTVNGKPVYYWSNVAGGTIPAGAGEVLLGNVTGVTVQGQTLWNASTGVEAGFSSGLKILGNTVSANTGEGISLYHSPANEISGNDVSRGEIGVVLWLSDGNTVANNNLSRNLIGIWIVASSRSIVRNNTLSANNGSGIAFVPPGTDNQVANNTATGNTFGIYTLGMGGVGMTGNVLSNNMHGILGGNGDTILENTAFSNTVNGIEVEGPNNVIASNHVYGNPEGIRVYNAGGNVIAGNNASGNGAGILLGSLTSGNTVLNNTAMNNDYGIEVGALSNGDAITRNNVTGSRIEGISIIQSTGTIVSENRIANNTLGVHLYRSSGTRVYHNTILGNSQQAYDELSGGNQWDDGYPSGGNRWSDYGGVDNCSGPAQSSCPNPDGIGDTPYTFSGGQDSYPLMTSPTPIPTPPSEPWNLRIGPGNRALTLTWSAPIDDGGVAIRNYWIYRGGTSGSEAFLLELGNVLTYTDTGLTNGAPYFYQVSAKNGVGEGPRSSEASGIPRTVPGPPVSLQAAPGDGQVTLTWAAPADDGGSPVTGYRIWRGTTPGGEAFANGVGNVSTYVDTGLSSGTRYYYQVSAVNAAGEGGRSTEAYATPPSPANQRPMCSIVTPASGDRVSGTYPITGTSGDPDGAVVRVEVRVDNGAWTTAAGTDSWRYNWDTRAASDGSHVVHARSYDGTDYSAEVSVTVTVDNGVPPPRSVFAEGWFYGLLGLVVLVSALLAFILWRERRKKRPPELSP